jgi:hypothetical protein
MTRAEIRGDERDILFGSCHRPPFASPLKKTATAEFGRHVEGSGAVT